MHAFKYVGVESRLRSLIEGPREFAGPRVDKFELADRARYALLEYVRDDDQEQLVADVATLRQWTNP